MMTGTLKAMMADHSTHSEPSHCQLPLEPDANHTDPYNSSLPQPPTPTARLSTPSPHPPSSCHTPLPNMTFRPAYHIARPHRKLVDWSFRPRKPVGDSNINRIPAHSNPDIQLASYPGANFYHFLKICETPPSPSTKILVLSVGLNNKDQDPKETSIKQLKALSRTARMVFPNADIYFPIINFSTNVTSTQQHNLKLINNTIAARLRFLIEIPHDTFITEADNIHWTPATAAAIFTHWCRQLSLSHI
ncbi:uncharacterized protein LOC125901372 [Epinephelus fuscoguttatus]|uniref:uncharacterized protein LOC125901372 n=1 Tax=Epinephelus fuscoguttatus TaxID=293821 RepID=UPI0020D0E1EC|nr:uncharacterized protein LOC125901372 [Epinephelus fuscoguttatus]